MAQKKKTLDVNHFLAKTKDTDFWQKKSICKTQIIKLLDAKINSVSFRGI